MRATVTNLHPHYSYFFARDIDAKRVLSSEHVFCDRRECDFEIATLRRHDVVDIGRVEEHHKGRRGYDVTFVRHPDRDPFIGRVTDVHPARGFAFVKATDGAQVIVIASDFLEPTAFDSLCVGTWLSGERIVTPRGYLGTAMALTRPDCIPEIGR
ncbi:MAG TPA: hypothetical protein VGD94_15400 [Vicinamibacterales bacterium]